MNKDVYQIDKEGYLEFKPEFFQNCMSKFLEDPKLKVISAKYLSQVGVTATTRMKYSGETDKLLGLFHYEITFVSQGQQKTVEILVKSKTKYTELEHRLGEVLMKSGIRLNNLDDWLNKTELYDTNMKEIYIYELSKTNPKMKKILPGVYGTFVDEVHEQYIVLEEFLKNCYVMKDYTDISIWDDSLIAKTVSDFIEFHSAYYDNYSFFGDRFGDIINTTLMVELKPLWLAYAENLRSNVGNLFTQDYMNTYLHWINTIEDWWGKIDKMKKTLIYDDAQIRNLAIRNPTTHPQLALYDWEVTTIQLPQRDIVEFLSYAISDRISDEQIIHYLEQSRVDLEKFSQQKIDRQEWIEGFLYSNYDFHVNRMACQLVLHKTLNRPDIERVYQASLRILNITKKM